MTDCFNKNSKIVKGKKKEDLETIPASTLGFLNLEMVKGEK